MKRELGALSSRLSPGLRSLIGGMRRAYARGENAMEFARRIAGRSGNSTIAALIAYDLQAGSYVAGVRANPEHNARWCSQLAEILNPFVTGESSILEVGCGEATTLAGVLQKLPHGPGFKLGFDISWSRCKEGLNWLSGKKMSARPFVADLFQIPLEDDSIDVVYTSHSIEPNGGREADAIRELMRVARRSVVLVEPIYELAHPEAQSRMRAHGYVRGLKKTIESFGASVTDYRLLNCVSNPLNPSGSIVIDKGGSKPARKRSMSKTSIWLCPLTRTPLSDMGDVFVSEQAGLVYPVLRGIPLLRAEHGVIASKIVD
jgi:SAM-dependent methyltransferase